jgi:dipeptidyl aminopeptidase/acylaminoacyl peptidase
MIHAQSNVKITSPVNSGSPADHNTSGYRMPPAALQAIVDAPRAPQLSLSPKRNLAALIQIPALPGISEVAQPELKLAGLRINPRTYADSRFTFGTDLWLLDIATQQDIRIAGLPAALRLADIQWSPDQRYLAFSHITQGHDAKVAADAGSADVAGVELWLVDIAAKKARRLSKHPLNSVYGRGFSWLPDSKSLLVRLKPANIKPAPISDGIPTGPAMQDSQPGGGTKQLRTYPDLLKNAQDAALFDHYTLVQLALLDLSGNAKLLGKPEQFTGASVAPNGQYLLTQSIDRPYSYIVPAASFPKRIEVRDLSGNVIHTLAKKPLEEGLPPGNDAVPTGPRSISWRADAPAAVVWVEAQDGGDPNRKTDVRDIVYALNAPFTAAPRSLAKLGSRFQGILWGRGDLALVEEGWYKTRDRKQWRIAPDQPDSAPELLYSGSSEDRYNDPGMPVMRTDDAGFRRMLIVNDPAHPGDSLLLDGQGASPEGDRPFLDRFNLQTKQKERLFRSSAPHYESVAAVLNDDGTRLLTTRESPTERPNYFVRDLGKDAGKNGEAQLTALTHFAHPTPQLKDIQKERIQYKRADGVDLNATLYLPPNYDAKRDGPLPLLMWAYPHEFKSASAAGQVNNSPYHFNAVSPSGALTMVAMGYAVLDDPSMPIVGEGKQEPNDTYLPQLIADAEAAVNEVVRRGVAERHRIAIGGHSYGAFMTGNLLAHTRLFKAGIARSGAYNRTLTPFGFQSEDRQYWQAKDVYQAMSPFHYAEQVKDAILFIHGEQDNNPGTFPIQSERMFQAIKGLGGTTRLVMLPNESHGYRARESIMHMLAETNDWLEKYVKNAKP